MRWFTISLLAAGLTLFSGCGKKANSTTGPQATVMLNDGTSFAGTVTASSTSSITVVAPNGEARTYPMTQVSSVQYGSAQTAQTTPAPAAPAPAAPAPVVQSSPPAQSTPPAESPAPAPATSPVPPSPPAPVTEVRVIPAGSSIVVRTTGTIDSQTATEGQTYAASIAHAVFDRNDREVIPTGADATLVVRSARAQGKVEGQSELVLDLESVRVKGRRYRVDTAPVVEKGHEGVGANKRTGTFLGGGAVLGTLLGAVAGGGKGAAIGAISGAAAGGATQTLTRGKGVRVPAETVLTFRLEAPIRVTEVR